MTVPDTEVDPLEAMDEKRLRELLRASQAFNSTIDLDVLIPRVLDLISETCRSEAGSLWVVEDDVLQCHYAVGPGAEQVMWLEVPLGAGIVGDVALKRRAELIKDVRKDPRFLHQVDKLSGFVTQSLITVPLVAGEDLYGAIQLVNARPDKGELEEDDLFFVEAIADDAAAALRNAKLFAVEKRARDLRALLEVSHQITSTFDLDAVLISIVNLAGRALRFDRCVLAVWHDEKLTVRGISGEAVVDRRAAAVRELESFLVWAASRHELLSVGNVQDEDDEDAAYVREHFADYLKIASVAGFLTLPIKDSEGDLGLLHLEFNEPTELLQWELESGQLLANQCALAIRNSMLYANVPFISWLEPLREKRNWLVALPGPVWMAYGAIAIAAALIFMFLPVPTRVSAPGADVRALVQRPARAEISGVVDEVLVRDGQQVQAGAPIARLRNEELLRDLRATSGEREVAERGALAADARGDRAGGSMARVRLAEASDAETLLGNELKRSTVFAPVSGTVLTQRINERVGSHVDAGDAVAWIGDQDWSELEMQVKQEDLGRVKTGARVRAKSSAYPGRRLYGVVTAIAPRASTEPGAKTPMYTVRASIDNHEHLLRPGMVAYGKISSGWRPLASVVLGRPWRWLRMHFWW